jgi:UDP-N-acetyl-D-mannosaminuronate dehydrogenase
MLSHPGKTLSSERSAPGQDESDLASDEGRVLAADGTESIKMSLSRAGWKIPASYLEAMKRAQVLFVAADHHAYQAVEGKGLERMIQVALDAQHK